MIAITVILAAVIGSFVLNLGGSLQDTAPQASFDFDYTDENVTIIHVSGDSITDSDTQNLTVDSPNSSVEWSSDYPISAGDSTTFEKNGNYSSGDTIRVVWTSANGDSSATLGQSTAQ